MKSSRSERAFTLVELVLLLAILGILAWVAVPKLGAFHQIKLAAAARRVASDLRYAQSLAIDRRVRHGVLFEPASGRYTVFAVEPHAAVEDPSDRGRPLGVDFHRAGEYQGIDIVSAKFGATPGVFFDYFGAPRDTAGRELEAPGQVLLSYEGVTAAVEIAPGTGKVTLR
jgi:type II secretory pathway pseudopilin PulG